MSYYSAADLARAFRTVRTNTLQLAEDIPDTHYGFRATPDTRSVSETLVHIAAQPRWQHQCHGIDRKTVLSFEDFGVYMAELRTYEATLEGKVAILAALKQGGDEFAVWLESLSDAALGETVSFAPGSVPPAKTRFEMLLGVKEHEMHHRAQLMVIQRMLGIVPHLTRARQARSQPAAAAPAR